MPDKSSKARDVEQPHRHSLQGFDDDDDEDDLAPLVAGSTVSPLEMESLRRKRKQGLENDVQQTPLIWWVIRTALLTMAAFIPFLVGVYFFGADNRANAGLNSANITWDSDSSDIESDTMTDAKEDAITAIEIERGTSSSRLFVCCNPSDLESFSP